MNIKEDYSNLIIKYLENTLSKDEADLFFDWINDDASNKKMFFQIKAIHDSAASKGIPINIEESWQRLLKKRNRQHNYKRFWKQALSYAAVAALAIGITSFVFMLIPDRNEIVASRYVGGDGIEADIVVLPDGTRVSLGSKTTFYYEPNYGKEKRNVYLEGEAYFEVEHQKKTPFIVNINGMKIKALGTSFNVMAYPKDSVFTTTLKEGKVSLTEEYTTKQTILTPNQQLVYNRNTGETNVYEVNADHYTSWTTGYYHFSEESLNSILKRLSYVYGITFDIKSEKLNNAIFTGTFYRGQEVEDLMEIINISLPIAYKIEEDNHVIIYE